MFTQLIDYSDMKAEYFLLSFHRQLLRKGYKCSQTNSPQDTSYPSHFIPKTLYPARTSHFKDTSSQRCVRNVIVWSFFISFYTPRYTLYRTIHNNLIVISTKLYILCSKVRTVHLKPYTLNRYNLRNHAGSLKV